MTQGSGQTTRAVKPWKKWAGVAAVFALAGASIFWGVRTAFPSPPEMPTDLDGITRVLQSKAFRDMSERQRQPYYDKMRELTQGVNPKELGERFRNLPKEIRDDPVFRANTRDAMADQMLTMISLWASTPRPLRNMVLDKFIDAEEARQKRPTTQRSPEQDAEMKARREREQKEGMVWVKQMVEQGNPQKQAFVSEMMKAMRARRIERGLSPEPSPRR